MVVNWVGPFGAFISDLLLQWIGFTAFLVPLWMGSLAWAWVRSRPGTSVVLRAVGAVMALMFVPALFALLPWHWRWAHAVPVEGVLGRLVSGVLVAYLNIQGAWIVASVLALAGVYFASAISFWALKEMVADRWIQWQAWRDRWRNWREDRADRRAEREEIRRGAKQSRAGPAHLHGSDRNRSGCGTGDAAAAEPPGRAVRAASSRAGARSGGPAGIPAHRGAGSRGPDPDWADTADEHLGKWGRDPGCGASGTSAQSGSSPRCGSNRRWVNRDLRPPCRPRQRRCARRRCRRSRKCEAGQQDPRSQNRDPSTSSGQALGHPVRLGPRPTGWSQRHRCGPSRPTHAAGASRGHARRAAGAAAARGKWHRHSRARRRRCAHDDRASEACERIQAAAQHAAERRRRTAGDPRRRIARRSQGAGGEMRRVRRARPGGADQSRADGDDLRVQARGRREVFARDRPGRRPVPGHAGRKHPDRAHGGQEHGRHPGAEPRARDDSPARRAGVGDLCQGEVAADAGHGQGHQRAHRDGRPGLDAARADRRFDRVGQVGGHQRHDHEPAVPHHAVAGAADPGGSEARGTGHVRGHSASVHAHHHRAQAGGQCAAQCGARDGAAAEAAGQPQRAQHRPVQQALRGLHAFAVRRRRRKKSRCPTS